MPRTSRSAASSGASTIVDVARQAGVSIKTVSRVVNRESGVREDTRERVMAAAQQLGWRPAQSARSLAGARSWLIGLLYLEPSAAFVAAVQQGATRRCREGGFHLVVESLADDGPLLRQQVEHMVATLRPDGMILTPPLCDDEGVLQALRESGTRFVQIAPGRDVPGVPSVRMGDASAAQEVTALLIDLGHRRIAFIRGKHEQAASRLREQGWRMAMQARGLPADETLVQTGAFNFDGGVQAAQRLLDLPERPTAVFAANDDMALGVLACAQQRGLRVPEDLSIAGFDDTPASSRVWPTLTTVRQPLQAMAALAVQLVASPPLAGEPLHRVLPYELLVRASTTAPRSGL